MAKTTPEADPPRMSKYEAVCAALRDGVAMPQAGVAHVKERYGIDMTPNQFSAHKTRAMSESPAANKPAEPEPTPPPAAVERAAPAAKAPKPAAPKPEAKAPPAAPKPKPPAPGSPADLARQVKQLVERHGAGAVADMLDVFKD